MKSLPQYIHRTHPRAKRMTLKVSPKGEVVVVTPRFTPKWSINLFVTNHLDWIAQQLSEIQQLQAARNTSAIKIFDKPYKVVLDHSGQCAAGVRVQADHVLVTPVEVAVANVWTDRSQEQLDQFLKHTARSYIHPRTEQLAGVMNISYGAIRYKQQKSRWGSCSSDGNLNFNWRLVHCPPVVIDYVIIHELAHRTHMDHSSRFWSLVAKYDPDHRLHRGWLKRHGKYFV